MYGVLVVSLVLQFTTTLASQCIPTIEDATNPVDINAAVFPGYVACVAVDDGKSKCWGNNGQGQLGLGDTNYRGDNPGEMGDNLPYTPWVNDKKIQYLAAKSGNHVLAFMEDNTVQGMGWNTDGQLCQGDNVNKLSPVEVDLGSIAVKALMTQAHWSCVLSDQDKLYCWGNNQYGQTGHKRQGDSYVGNQPGECGDNLQAVDLGTTGKDGGALPAVKEYAMGGKHACALFDDNSMKCWGSNMGGVLGLNIGETDNRGDDDNEMGDDLPFLDIGDYVVKHVHLGSPMSCIETTEAEAVCWGHAKYLGVNPADTIGVSDSSWSNGIGMAEGENNKLPGALRPIDFGTTNGEQIKVKQMSCAYSTCCVLLETNDVKCWGYNYAGQCGMEPINDDEWGHKGVAGDDWPAVDFSLMIDQAGIPVDGASDRYAVKVMAGQLTMWAVLDDGSLVGWGSSRFGGLGTGDDSWTHYLNGMSVPIKQELANVMQSCSASGSSSGSAPQAGPPTFKNKRLCYRWLDSNAKKADLESMLSAFVRGDTEAEKMTCVMKQLSKEWPHTAGAGEPNQKHNRPQLKFDVNGGYSTVVQERRKTPRGGFKQKCYTDSASVTISVDTSISVAADAVKTESDWCNPCADIMLSQTTTSGDQTTTIQMNLECKTFYGTDNKGKTSDKCEPKGLKCRKGTYTLDEGTPDVRNVNHGRMKCEVSSSFDDDKWKTDC
jgi:alpha-tubulin suppressor-like RCC1 family protein